MDPATIQAILSGMREYLNQYNDAIWKDKVSGKLDEISAKLDIVILELKDLKVWVLIIHDEVVNIAPLAFKNQVESARRQIEADGPAIISGSASKNQIDSVIAARNSIGLAFGSLYDWRSYGFSYYYAVIAGVLTHIYASTILKITADAIEKTAEDACNLYLLPAIEAENSKSIESAKRAQLETAAAIDLTLAATTSRWWLTNFEPGTAITRDENGVTPGSPARWRAVRVTGDVRSGFHYEQDEGEWMGGKIPKYQWYPGIKAYNMGDGNAGLDAVKALIAESVTRYNSAVDAADRLQQHVFAIQSAIASLSDISVQQFRRELAAIEHL